jgi:hypothetical protein
MIRLGGFDEEVVKNLRFLASLDKDRAYHYADFAKQLVSEKASQPTDQQLLHSLQSQLKTLLEEIAKEDSSKKSQIEKKKL